MIHSQNGEATLFLPTLSQLQLGFLSLVPNGSWLVHIGSRWQSQDLKYVLCDSTVYDLTQHVILSFQLNSISCIRGTWSISRQDLQVSTALKIRLYGSLPRVLILHIFVPHVYKTAFNSPLWYLISVYEPFCVAGVIGRRKRRDMEKARSSGTQS